MRDWHISKCSYLKKRKERNLRVVIASKDDVGLSERQHDMRIRLRALGEMQDEVRGC